MTTATVTRYAALVGAAHRLALEINSGATFRQDTLATLLAAGAVTARTRHGALRQVVRSIREAYPDYEPAESVTRAMLGTSTRFGRG